jgi:hypothetical protein
MLPPPLCIRVMACSSNGLVVINKEAWSATTLSGSISTAQLATKIQKTHEEPRQDHMGVSGY